MGKGYGIKMRPDEWKEIDSEPEHLDLEVEPRHGKPWHDREEVRKTLNDALMQFRGFDCPFGRPNNETYYHVITRYGKEISILEEKFVDKIMDLIKKSVNMRLEIMCGNCEK